MAEKLTIEIFRRKDAEDFTRALSDPESRTAVGSGAAMTAAIAAAYLHRASALCAAEKPEDERLAWLVRNSETLRTYMVQLIDEDVKCRGPLRRARKEGDARAIEAAHQPAVAIANEIVNMMGQCIDLALEMTTLAGGDAKAELAAGADLAYGASLAAGRYILQMSRLSPDDTYRYVMKRENELTMQAQKEAYDRVIGAAATEECE